jgi:hypothetical protein
MESFSGGPNDRQELTRLLDNWKEDALKAKSWSLAFDDFTSMAATYVPRQSESLVFQLQSVDADQPIEDGAQGLSIRHRWRSLEPKEGQFDWRYLDNQVLKAGNLPFMLRIMGGNSAPRWAGDQASVVEGTRVPVPWDATLVRQVTRMMAAVAERYQNVFCIHTTGWWKSSEMGIPNLWKNLPGFSNTALRDYHLLQVEAIREENDDCWVSFNLAPPGGKPWVDLIWNAAKDMPMVCVQSNALGAQATETRAWVEQIVDFPGQSAWQMLCPVSNQERFNPKNLPDDGVPYALNLGATADPLFYEYYRFPLGKAIPDAVDYFG